MLYLTYFKLAMVVAQVVAHQTMEGEVPDSIPVAAKCWLFSLYSLSYLSIIGLSLIRSLVEVQHYWVSAV